MEKQLIVLLVTVNDHITRLNSIDDDTPKRINDSYYIPAIGNKILLSGNDCNAFDHLPSNCFVKLSDPLTVTDVIVDYKSKSYKSKIIISVKHE
jgi:hypothetical protein